METKKQSFKVGSLIETDNGLTIGIITKVSDVVVEIHWVKDSQGTYTKQYTFNSINTLNYLVATNQFNVYK